jgi:hypothetical protein
LAANEPPIIPRPMTPTVPLGFFERITISPSEIRTHFDAALPPSYAFKAGPVEWGFVTRRDRLSSTVKAAWEEECKSA